MQFVVKCSSHLTAYRTAHLANFSSLRFWSFRHGGYKHRTYFNLWKLPPFYVHPINFPFLAHFTMPTCCWIPMAPFNSTEPSARVPAVTLCTVPSPSLLLQALQCFMPWSECISKKSAIKPTCLAIQTPKAFHIQFQPHILYGNCVYKFQYDPANTDMNIKNFATILS